MFYDEALVSLELAVIYAREGRTEPVKNLTRHLVPIFPGQGRPPRSPRRPPALPRDGRARADHGGVRAGPPPFPAPGPARSRLGGRGEACGGWRAGSPRSKWGHPAASRPIATSSCAPEADSGVSHQDSGAPARSSRGSRDPPPELAGGPREALRGPLAARPFSTGSRESPAGLRPFSPGSAESSWVSRPFPAVRWPRGRTSREGTGDPRGFSFLLRERAGSARESPGLPAEAVSLPGEASRVRDGISGGSCEAR